MQKSLVLAVLAGSLIVDADRHWASGDCPPAEIVVAFPSPADAAISDEQCVIASGQRAAECLTTATLEGAVTPWDESDLVEGSWAQGRHVFFSRAAGCSHCHALSKTKNLVGPSLADVASRPRQSVLRDIMQPAAVINAAYIAESITLLDGTELTGLVRRDGADFVLHQVNGGMRRVSASSVVARRRVSTSIMPTDAGERLSSQQLQDLMAYLMTGPPSMPLRSPLPAPKLRAEAEVQAALAGAPQEQRPRRPLRILLVAGPKDHGPGEHDYPAWQSVWHELLLAAPQVSVERGWEFPADSDLAAADVVIFFQKGDWNRQRAEAVDRFLNRGGGLVYIHWAVNGNAEAAGFADRIGYSSAGGKISYRHGPLSLQMLNTQHPVLRNFNQLQLYDESYWKLTGDPKDVTVLATSLEDGEATPQMWVREKGEGRVFVSIPGHYSWTFDDPLFRILLLRGIAWTAHEPVDRFNELVTVGARMKLQGPD